MTTFGTIDLADKRLHVQRYRRRWLPDMEREKAKAPDAALKAIREVINGLEPWPLLFWGEPGSRKTCTALLLLDHYGGLYSTADFWHKRLIEAGKGELWEGQCRLNAFSVREEWHAAKVTVLDELAEYNVTLAACQTVKVCIDARWGRPAIFITNLDPYKELGNVYDDRIINRLLAGTLIKFTGDFRTNPKW